MKITESTVKKISITDIRNLDPINVFVEDFGPGRGRITIECFGDSWSHGWIAMGDNHDVMSFFCKAHCDYLAGKLSPNTIKYVDDEDAVAVADAMRKEIISRRREDCISKEMARELWEQVEWAGDEVLEDHNLLYSIFGEEWWHCLPKRDNPKYLYLIRIIGVIKEAFAEIMSQLVLGE